MDASERIAYEFLKYSGYKDIVYEPDGNVPPDFLVNTRIAIEVRRLNQNYCKNGNFKGLEETAIPLWKKIEKFEHTTAWRKARESTHKVYKVTWQGAFGKISGLQDKFKSPFLPPFPEYARDLKIRTLHSPVDKGRKAKESKSEIVTE